MSKIKIYFDKITLGFGQSLIMGNRPENLKLPQISQDKKDLEVSKFGLFETASPNFHTYYPEVKAEDIKPKEEDFIKPIFRALSEVIVHKNFNPIDFSKNGVLKNSMTKLLGQTIYANHEAVIGNEIGVVSNIEWQNSYVTNSGIKIPSGINAEFKIDSKAHPNIARAIMMEPPSIHSNSVTVSFGWEQSHPSMDINEFRSKLGTFGSDGQLIRRIANEIKNYHETSLVPHGADPFAQVIKKGVINNAEYANSTYSLSMEGKEKPKNYFFSYKEDVVSMGDKDTTPQELNNINPETPMKELIQKLAIKYKIAEDQITEQLILDKLEEKEKSESQVNLAKELQDEKANNKDLTNKLADKVTEITNLTRERDSYKQISDKAVDTLKNEVKRAYGVLKGDKADEAKLDQLQKLDYEGLLVEMKSFNEELENKYPATCNKCGSHEVSRNTAAVISPDSNGGKITPKDNSQLMAQIRKESKKDWILEPSKIDKK